MNMKKMMSSKERVLTTLARQEPDRLPIAHDANAGIVQRLTQDFFAALLHICNCALAGKPAEIRIA